MNYNYEAASSVVFECNFGQRNNNAFSHFIIAMLEGMEAIRPLSIPYPAAPLSYSKERALPWSYTSLFPSTI